MPHSGDEVKVAQFESCFKGQLVFLLRSWGTCGNSARAELRSLVPETQSSFMLEGQLLTASLRHCCVIERGAGHSVAEPCSCARDVACCSLINCDAVLPAFTARTKFTSDILPWRNSPTRARAASLLRFVEHTQ